jgi:hypothetical protein
LVLPQTLDDGNLRLVKLRLGVNRGGKIPRDVEAKT